MIRPLPPSLETKKVLRIIRDASSKPPILDFKLIHKNKKEVECYVKGPMEQCWAYLFFHPKSRTDIVVRENTNNTNNENKMFLSLSPQQDLFIGKYQSQIRRIISIVLDIRYIVWSGSNVKYLNC